MSGECECNATVVCRGKYENVLEALNRAWPYVRDAQLTGNIPWAQDKEFVETTLSNHPLGFPFIKQDSGNELVEKILADIVADFTDRRGLRQEWENIDDQIRGEIKDSWREIIYSALTHQAQASEGEGE